MAYNEPHLAMPIRNFYPNPIHTYSGFCSVTVHKQHIGPHWLNSTETHKLQTYSNHKDLAKFTIWSLNHILHVSFDVTSPNSTESSTCNTSSWIIIWHHPDDIIVILLGSPLDTDFSDQFTQPSAEQNSTTD